MATVEKKTYYRVAAALMGLLVLTVAVSFLPLGDVGVVVALGIAFAKMGLILLFFMHVRYGSPLTKVFAAVGFFWLLLLFVLTFSDYLTRG